MTKDQLIEAIQSKGVDVDEYATKKEIQSIYDTLFNEPEKQPEQPGQDDTVTGTEQPGQDEQPPETDEFADLQSKIAGATVPPEQKRKRRSPIEKTARKKKRGQSDPDSFRVEGYILLLIVDTIFPFSFAFLNNLFDKKIKVQASDLQLDEKAMAKLEPLADQAADYMAVNINPIAGFLLISSFMYGNALMTVRMNISNSPIPTEK